MCLAGYAQRPPIKAAKQRHAETNQAKTRDRVRDYDRKKAKERYEERIAQGWRFVNRRWVKPDAADD